MSVWRLFDTPLRIKVVSWNILADRCAHYRPYAKFPGSRSERYRLLERELKHFQDADTDFICLQEVDVKVARQTLRGGYERLKTPTGCGSAGERTDACCIFYKKKDWILVEEEICDMDLLATKGLSESSPYRHPMNFTPFQKCFRRNNYGIIARFENLTSGEQVVVSNTHLYWDPDYEFVKFCQTMYLLYKIKGFIGSEECAIVFCGDLNSLPSSAVHILLTHGKVDNTLVKVHQELNCITNSDEELSVYNAYKRLAAKPMHSKDALTTSSFHLVSSNRLERFHYRRR